MRKWMLAAGAAALAIVSPALADPKGQKGGGKGNEEHSGHVMKAKGGGDRDARARGGDKQRGPTREVVKSRGNDRSEVKAAKRADRDDARMDRMDDRGKVKVRGSDRDDDVRVVGIDRDDDLRFAPRWGDNGLRLGFADGCPPGLAKKGTGCLPPGQAKKIVGTSLAAAALGLSPLGGPYRSWYRDNDDFFYRWDDDYIYRIRRDGDLIDALFPYANRDFYYYPVGAPYPDYFNYYNVPFQYQSFYPNGGDYWYRYGDGAIYMVDPETRMIQGIAALLTGNPLAVGQPLPPAYGVYNVPLGFRDTYYDTPDSWYRYNDGYIYRVDPATMLVTAVINAIA